MISSADMRYVFGRWSTCCAALAVGGALAAPSLWAQAVPDAGDALRESSPPPAVLPGATDAPLLPAPPAPAGAIASGGPSFTLRKLDFVGNSAIASTRLDAAMAEWIGREVTLADLQSIANAVTTLYREEGYLLAEAIIPVQEIVDGRVEISVIEGTLGAVRLEVDPAAPVRAATIQRITGRMPAGEPLRAAALERTMLLLSDLPGVQPEAALEPGAEPGSVDLVVGVAPRRRWDLLVDADNHGSRATSEYRVGLQGRVNSPLRLGDNLDARVQLGAGGRLAYGRLAYELPVGGHGTRLGASYARVDYELGKDFVALDASGEADVYEIGLSHPIVRARARNLFGRLGWQEKRLDDRLGVIEREDGKKIRNLFAGLVFEQRDALLGGGYTSAGLTAYFGRLSLEPVALAEDLAGRRTAGDFKRWSYSLSRLNALGNKTNLYFALSGQVADKNLDSAEKVSLGGPRAVRAYAPSEATVDVGHLASLELRYALSPEASLQVFHDWGWGKYNRKRSEADIDNDVSLRGAGLGLFWGMNSDVILRGSVAWRTTARGEAEKDRVPRVYVQVSKAF